ncbi:MAG: response regulator [Clostridia bacterium]|nr:response regulator [Clostridia bacterium]
MEHRRTRNTIRVAVAGGLVVLIILVLGSLWVQRSARTDTAQAVRQVSLLYLDELAGRREQVVAANLRDSIEKIRIAVGLMTEEDLKDDAHLQAYQARMKALYGLEKFAFVDTDGLIYTSQGTQDNIGDYAFDPNTLSEPEISLFNLQGTDRTVVIAVPVDLVFQGRPLVVCFMEIDMTSMLEGVSMASEGSGATFCNIYTPKGVALSNTVLGGLAMEDNLLEALSHAVYEEGYSYEQVAEDFARGRAGVVSFTYGGIPESLSYVPVEGTDWLLTYLIRESVVSQEISSVSRRIISRSLIQSLLSVLVLGSRVAFILVQSRKNDRLKLEKETADAESRARQQEMEERLRLQDQLLAQKARQEQQEKMIAALASDYRSVYYLDLSQDSGICYQPRTDFAGLREGEPFVYTQAISDYCERYVLEPYRQAFRAFVRPEAVLEGLRGNRVISYRYMIRVGERESYEMIRYARVSAPDGEGIREEHSVGACFTDVDEETRKALARNQALSDALATADQANRAKTAFLSSMSHEIRTPMNAIIGLNNIALNEPGLPEKVRDYLTRMGDSAQHLLGIINDILDMSRIESGRMVLRNEEFSFARNLEQVNTIIGGQCRGKGLDYICHTVGQIDDYYIGDGLKLKQVLINILGNAVKFTPEGGSVTFDIQEGPRFDGKATLKFVIRDTGIGMSPEFLPHIFDAFSQEDASSTNRYGSTGLGLSITRSIVEMMNGTIDVQSEKGVGTTFTVSVTLGESDRVNAEAEVGEISPHDMDVLVIDDDAIALEHAQVILSQVGIHCETARSGEEGLERIRLRHGRRKDYDLVLVDWRMPDMDGVETTRRIREIVGSDTPIVILTSFNWDEVEQEARQAGVDTFLAKPLFAGTVLEEFREAFKRKHSAPRGRSVDLKGRRVLLAEDVAVNAEIMVMVLGMKEIEVETAENGRIAVEMFEGSPIGYYDAILMDMRMPEMDGLEATRVIRKLDRPDAAAIPIIALTANAFDEDVQRSLQAGLNAHLSKPVEPQALFDTLQELIRE